MRNIFKDLVNEFKLIRMLRRANPSERFGLSTAECILEAKKGANYMHTIEGVINTTPGNIDELMRKVFDDRFDPNDKITGIIVFMDKK
jgi:hypothetical protein